MSTAAKIWTWPIVLAIASCVGLISALVGDGIWDVLSWIALGLPLVVIAIFAAPTEAR